MLRRDSDGTNIRDLPEGKFVAGESEGHARLEIDGEVRRVYWAASRLTGWKVVLNIPESTIIGPVHTLTKRLLGFGALEVLFMILIVTAISRRVTQPLEQLTAAAGDLESGKFRSASLDQIAKKPDELGRLATSFQTMAREIHARETKLAEWNQNLEKTVAARTTELAQALQLMAGELAEASDYVRSSSPPRTRATFAPPGASFPRSSSAATPSATTGSTTTTSPYTSSTSAATASAPRSSPSP